MTGVVQVVFEKEEVTQMKRFDNPGLVLMGFKPVSTVKPQYNVHNGYFIYPDDSVIIATDEHSGSSQCPPQ